MVMSHPFVAEIPSIWFDKWRCDDAEKAHQEKKSGACVAGAQTGSSLVTEIAKARRQIQNSLKTDSVSIAADAENEIVSRLQKVELENQELRTVTNDLRQVIKAMESRILAMEKASSSGGQTTTAAKPAAAPAAAESEEDDDDDDIDLFGSDDEEESAAAAKIREDRLAAYAAKKSKKPALIAKSSILLDIKPWDDETDMKEMERLVRTVVKEGLLWGASKLVPLAYGIRKLQINVIVEDDKVGTDDLEDALVAFEDYVQSVDIAAFNKI